MDFVLLMSSDTREPSICASKRGVYETRLGRGTDEVELGGRELSTYDGLKNNVIPSHVKDKQFISTTIQRYGYAVLILRMCSSIGVTQRLLGQNVVSYSLFLSRYGRELG